MENKNKFKAWDNRYNIMRKVFVIDYRNEGYQMVEMDSDCDKYERWGNTKDHIILLQSTGLNDKNGKEIYESDIVRFNNTVESEVTFKDGCFCWKFEPLCYDFSEIDEETMKPEYLNTEIHCEIVGNIHELHTL